MQKFDSLEIQKNVEEKRLIMGQKIEAVLVKNLLGFFAFCSRILSCKSTAFIGSIFIIAISILARSSRDIGHDSATYLEIAQKILQGGRYYHDFFELNFPLSFWITLLPVSVANLFGISAIIASEIFVNLLGVFTLYFCYRILLRCELARDSKAFNLLILSFATGFFWRVFTLQFNEFATKTTYLLALAFPYFCYHLLARSTLTRLDHLISGILAALIFALKPNYGILVILFEGHKLLQSRNLKSIFCLRNYITLALLICYLALIYFLAFDYFQNFEIISNSYYEVAAAAVLFVIKEDALALLLFIFLTRFLTKNYPYLQQFYLLAAGAILIVISEMIGGYDQRFIIYSFGLPTIVISCYLLIKDQYFDFRKQGIFLIFLLLLPQADAKNIFALALDLCAFWWVFVLIKSRQKSLPKSIFSPKDFWSWLGFALIAIIVVALSFKAQTAFLSWLFSAILFAAAIDFYQKQTGDKKITLLFASALALVLSYFLALHIAAIFNLKMHQLAFNYKSPNHVNSQMIKIAKSYSAKDEEVVMIAQLIPSTYPSITYMDKQNQLAALQMPLLFKQIVKESKDQRGASYLLSQLKEQLLDKKNKLVFVEIKNDLDYGLCQISFLEYYLRDAEFRKIFLSNYRFLNRIIDSGTEEEEVQFFGEELKIETAPGARIRRDIEVYVRK